MSRHADTGNLPWWKLTLAIGFLSLTGATLLAHSSPATGYELSIYTMTSRWVWVGLLLALSISAIGSLSSSADRSIRSLALLLGGLVMTVFLGLPIIRGYRFYGHHDALTHLGWARAIGDGTILPFDLFYPAIHMMTAITSVTVDVPLSRAMLLIVLLSALLFCVFVPLTVSQILPGRSGVSIAMFSAFLLLPITTISMYLQAHAMTQAVLFSTVLVFLFVKYVRHDRNLSTLSATGLLLFLVGTAAVVYHPQMIAHLIAVFLAISIVQYVARRLWTGGSIAQQPSVYGFTLFLIALFLLWSANHGFFSGMLEYFFDSVIEYVFARGSGGEEAVATQGGSLASIGGSLIGIFLKLFFVHLVFSLIAGSIGLGLFFFRDSELLTTFRAETTYFVAALAGLTPLFFVYFASAGSTMYFRVVGLMMVFVTILGAIGIYGLVGRLSSAVASSRAHTVGRPLLSVGLVVLVVLSLATVFPSPYIYNSSPQVSDAQMGGYETAFEMQGDEIEFAGLRNGPNRFDDAIHGNAERERTHQDVPASSFGDLAGEYDTDRYLVLTSADYERETIAYDELRYSADQFEGVEDQQRVDRIQSNGEFELFYIDADSDDGDSTA